MADLKMSQELIDNVQQTIIDADETAKNPSIALQYLSAISGYMLASQDLPKEQKDKYMEQLTVFAKHVLDDVSKPAAPVAPAAAKAFGVWKPKK